jgi:hypothetical protein
VGNFLLDAVDVVQKFQMDYFQVVVRHQVVDLQDAVVEAFPLCQMDYFQVVALQVLELQDVAELEVQKVEFVSVESGKYFDRLLAKVFLRQERLELAHSSLARFSLQVLSSLLLVQSLAL